MEPRQSEVAVRQDGDWNAEDVKEYNGIKQIGIMMGFSPMMALVSSLLLLVVPASFPILRGAAFMVALTSLMCLGIWAAGIISRLWQVEVKPLAAPSPLAAGEALSKERANRPRRVPAAVSGSARRVFGSARPMSVLPLGVRSSGPAPPPAPRSVA